MNGFKHKLLHLISWLFPRRVEESLFARVTKPLRERILNNATDDILEVLLSCMELAFSLSRRYRRNIQGFTATLVFRTRATEACDSPTVAAAAQFTNGRMRMLRDAPDDYQAAVVFSDARALWSFLLSENQDILDSLLSDDIRVEKNLNYVYRFGFLAKELTG